MHLKTRTKMFCRCELEYGAAENTHTCPVCLAHPGALPVPNGQRDRDDDPARPRARLRDLRARRLRAQELLLSRPAEGLPDQPVRGAALRAGEVRRPDRRRRREIGIVRAHLEEDAAKTVHAGGATGRSVGADYSLVDFNRGGTPLLEIVTEPDLRSADEAIASSGCCARRSSSSASPTRRWRRARCAPTSTSPCASAARRATGRAGRSRT